MFMTSHILTENDSEKKLIPVYVSSLVKYVILNDRILLTFLTTFK